VVNVGQLSAKDMAAAAAAVGQHSTVLIELGSHSLYVQTSCIELGRLLSLDVRVGASFSTDQTLASRVQ